MNTKGIRYRLSVWYSVIFFASILIFFSSFYLVMQRTLVFQTDTLLQTHAKKLVDIVSQENTNLQEAIARQLFLETFSQIPGELVIIINASGEIVASSLSSNLTAETFSGLFNKVRQDKTAFTENISIGQFTMRIYAAPILRNDTFSGVVFVGSPLDIINQSLQSLSSFLLIAFIALSIPTLLGGYFLAGRALKPITRISRTLSRISSENLNERVQNPDTNDELEELAVSFNRLLTHLDKAFRRERELIQDIAHELKTPLATLRSGVEITLRKPREKREYQETLAEVVTDADRMTDLLDNILDLAWSKADYTGLKVHEMSLSELVEQIHETTLKMAPNKKLKVKALIQKGVLIKGQKDKLVRALLNVIDNAIKYSPQGSTIELSLATKGNNAHFSVKDQGIGIAKEDIPLIFKRLYRGSNTKEMKGSGLGLAISQAIVEAHKGHISIESTVNKGTQVTISLPYTNK